jgi:hypothetical protein
MLTHARVQDAGSIEGAIVRPPISAPPDNLVSAPPDDLVAIAKDRLSHDGYFCQRMHRLDIVDHDGTLVLNGRLPSFYLKQILQTVVAQIDGVVKVDNLVEVQWPSDE